MSVESRRALQVAEIVYITIISAKLVDDADLAGKSDPYVVVEIVGKPVSTPQTKAQTKVIYNNLNPIFNEGLQIKNYYPGEALLFSVMDKDKGGYLNKDDCVGTVTLSSSSFYPDGFRGDLVLQPPQHGKRGGVLTVQVTLSSSLSHWQHKPRMKPPVTTACPDLSLASVTAPNSSPPVVAQSAPSVSAGALVTQIAASPQPVKPYALLTNPSPSNGHTASQSTSVVQAPLHNQIPAGGTAPAPANIFHVQQRIQYQVAAAPTKLSYVASPATVPYMLAPAQGHGIGAHNPCPLRVNVFMPPPTPVACTSAAPPIQCFASPFSPQNPCCCSQQPGVYPNFAPPAHHTSYAPGVNGFTAAPWQQPISPGRVFPGAPRVVRYIRRRCPANGLGYTTPSMSYPGPHRVSARGILMQHEVSPRIPGVVSLMPPSNLLAVVPAAANNGQQLEVTEDSTSNTFLCGAQYTPSNVPQTAGGPAVANAPQPHSNPCSQR